MFASIAVRVVIAIAFVTLVLPVGSQQPKAPKVTTCREDQKLYIAKFNEATRQWLSHDKASEWPLPTAQGLTRWSEEMGACKKVDPDNKCDYDFTVGEINAEKVIRLGTFLNKHNLIDQFRREDAKGELQFR